MTKFLRAIIQSGDQAVRNVCPLRTPQSAHLNPIYTFYNGPQIRDVAATQTWKLLQFLLMRFLKIKSWSNNFPRICLIAEWYSVWQEVAQVKQGLALLVLGWVTACYRCLDSTCSALTQLLQTACEVTNG